MGVFPQCSVAFGLNPTSQLVIGYHWDSVSKSVSCKSRIPETWIEILLNEKIKIKGKLFLYIYVSEHCVFFSRPNEKLTTFGPREGREAGEGGNYLHIMSWNFVNLNLRITNMLLNCLKYIPKEQVKKVFLA